MVVTRAAAAAAAASGVVVVVVVAFFFCALLVSPRFSLGVRWRFLNLRRIHFAVSGLKYTVNVSLHTQYSSNESAQARLSKDSPITRITSVVVPVNVVVNFLYTGLV